MALVNETADARDQTSRDEAHGLGLGRFAEVGGEEKDESGDEFGMAGCEQEGGLAGQSAGHENRGIPGAGRTEKFGEGFDMVVGIEGGGRPLGFTEPNQIRREDFVSHGEAGVNLRPFVGGCAEEHAVQKNQRRAGSTDMVNNVSA